MQVCKVVYREKVALSFAINVLYYKQSVRIIGHIVIYPISNKRNIANRGCIRI